MSLFRYQGSKVWTMDFLFHGQRIRESTGTRSKTLAQKIQNKRRRALEEGTAGIRKHQQPRLLSVASGEWLELKRATLAPRSLVIEKTNLAHLLPELGRTLVCDIQADGIARYQQNRVDADASPKTSIGNRDSPRHTETFRPVGTLTAPGCEVLPTRDDIGRAIRRKRNPPCYRLAESPVPALWLHLSPWRLRPGADTGNTDAAMGQCGLREPLPEMGAKTRRLPGTGRVIPLSQRAMAALNFWATHFQDRKPEHYVFPAERYGAAGDEFFAKAYDVDPSKPIGSIKEAWEAAKLRAGRILKGISEGAESEEKIPVLVCRFPRTISRHTAVSRMLNAGIPIAKVAKTAG